MARLDFFPARDFPWTSENRVAAAQLGDAGFYVHPCRSSPDGQHEEKTPYLPHWKEGAVRDYPTISKYWSRYPEAMPAIHLGASRLLVIDADRKHGLDGVLAWHCMVLANTRTDAPYVKTPGNGLHIYFRQPEGMEFGNSPGLLKGKGIDVRGSGGYVIGPDAHLPDGRRYELVGDLGEIPVMPDWLIAKLSQKAPDVATHQGRAEPRDAYIQTALDGELEKVRSASKGGRNSTLNNAAHALGTMVGPGWILRGEAESLLISACQDNGFDAGFTVQQCRKTIASGLNAGIVKPRQAPVEQIQTIAPLPSPMEIPEATLDELDSLLYDSKVLFDGDPLPERRQEIIDDILPRDGTGMLGGQSSVGKSFLVADLAVAIASGQPFFGRDVRTRVGIFVLALEGSQGSFQYRLDVAKMARGLSSALPISYKPVAPDFSKAEGVAEFLGYLGWVNKKFQRDFGVPLGLVIIDTMAKAFVMKKEDDSSEATETCKKLADIGARLDAFVLGVKHYGKDVEKGMRGSSAWRDNVDVVWAAIGERDPISLKWKNRRLIIDKSRDGEDGLLSAYDLDFVKLGVKDSGKEWGSMTVRAMLEQTLSKGTKGRPKQAEKSFMEALNSCMDSCSFEYQTSDGELIRAVMLASIRRHVMAHYPTDQGDPTKRKEILKKAVQNGREAALEAGRICIEFSNDGDIIWPIY